MEITSSIEKSFDHAIPLVVPTWDSRLARYVSQIASPPLLAALSAAMIGWSLNTRFAWSLVSFEIGFAILLPVLFISWLLRRGKISDFDVYLRRQRFWPYLFTVFCSLATLGLFWVLNAPSLLLALAAAALAQIVAMFAINFFWKISAHAAGAAGFATLLFYIVGAAAFPVFLLIPLMIWSRLRLRRHTLGQTLAGALLGVLIFVFFLSRLGQG